MSKKVWQFRKEEHRKWYWSEVDEMGRMLRKSARYFKERIDCVAHAMRHGYVHPRQRALATRSTTQVNPLGSQGSLQQ